MEALLLSVALLLLIVPGLISALLIVSESAVSRVTLALGYGVIAGLVGVPVLMRLLHSLNFSLSFFVSGSAVGIVTLALLAALIRKGSSLIDVPRPMPVRTATSAWDKALVALLLAVILVRFGSLLVDVVLRPLYPWDATMHWATKARVWFEYLELRPFVERASWLSASGEGVFNDTHPHYPKTIPLLQLWMTAAIGRWDESLMNLPWALCFVGLGAAFYGQAREAGASSVNSLAFTYLLLSLPLLNTHVALAGYADLFLGSCYCLAIMAFHNWSVGRERSQVLLAVFFALSCTLIKNEGIFWLLTFLPGLVVVLLPGRRALLSLFGLLLLTIVSYAVFPRDYVVAGHSLERLEIFYRQGALKAVFDSFFSHDSWHLFAYLFVSLVLLALLFRRRHFSEYAAAAVVLGSALCLFLFLFVFTSYSVGALRFTAVGRISLHLVPALMFFCLLMWEILVSGLAAGTRKRDLINDGRHEDKYATRGHTRNTLAQ